MSIILAAALLTQSAWDWRCRDDRGRDFCDEAVQQEVLGKFNAKHLRAFVSARSKIRRTLIVDGYGRDLALIEFIREEGRDPYFKVSAYGNWSASPAHFEAIISESEWNEAVSQSNQIHLKLVKRDAEQKSQASSIPPPPCLHSWLYWSEAYGEGETRSIVQDACEQSTSHKFAWWAAEFALEKMPFCEELNRREQRTLAHVIKSCLSLSGDRAAAASYVAYRSSSDRWGPASPLSYRFYSNGKLTMGGRRLEGSGAQAAWDAMGGEGQSISVSLDRIHATRSTAVELSGRVLRYDEDGPAKGSYEAAPMEAIWSRRAGDRYWKIVGVTVGEFAPWSPPTE